MLFKYREVLLGSEVLAIAKGKLITNAREKKGKIIGQMKHYYKREYKYSLLKDKYESITEDVLNKISINELKTIIHYLGQEDDSPYPTKKADIVRCEKLIHYYILILINRYLMIKGVNRADIGDLSQFLSKNDLIHEL